MNQKKTPTVANVEVFSERILGVMLTIGCVADYRSNHLQIMCVTIPAAIIRKNSSIKTMTSFPVIFFGEGGNVTSLTRRKEIRQTVAKFF